MIQAVADINWNAINVLVTTAMALALTYVGAKAKKIDSLEAKVDAKDADLKRATEASVELKLATQAAQFSGSVAELKFQCAEFQSRLAAGHSHMGKLDDAIAAAAQRDNDLRIELMRAIGELKDMVATKDDLDRIRRETQR